MTSDTLICAVFSGLHAIKKVRNMIGSTNPLEANPGTIRGDYATYTRHNIIHASDSFLNSLKEINLWFNENEIFDDKEIIEKECI